MKIIRLSFLGLLFVGVSSWAAPIKTRKPAIPQARSEKKTEWMLKKLLVLSQNKPKTLIKFSEQILHPNRVRQSTLDIKKAHEWQHRLATISALGDLFRKRSKDSLQISYLQKQQARNLILRSLKTDPALLVRDGAAETIRRIIKSNPSEFHANKEWKKALEASYLDAQNSIDGEGLFIKETILTALKESKRPLSLGIIKNTKTDKNKRLQKLL